MTATEAKAGIAVIQTFAEAIRTAGSRGIPSGHLYAMAMGNFSLDQYNHIINMLKNTGLVREDKSHLLKWVDGGSK